MLLFGLHQRCRSPQLALSVTYLQFKEGLIAAQVCKNEVLFPLQKCCLHLELSEMEGETYAISSCALLHSLPSLCTQTAEIRRPQTAPWASLNNSALSLPPAHGARPLSLIGLGLPPRKSNHVSLSTNTYVQEGKTERAAASPSPSPTSLAQLTVPLKYQDL